MRAHNISFMARVLWIGPMSGKLSYSEWSMGIKGCRPVKLWPLTLLDCGRKEVGTVQSQGPSDTCHGIGIQICYSYSNRLRATKRSSTLLPTIPSTRFATFEKT